MQPKAFKDLLTPQREGNYCRDFKLTYFEKKCLED